MSVFKTAPTAAQRAVSCQVSSSFCSWLLRTTHERCVQQSRAPNWLFPPAQMEAGAENRTHPLIDRFTSRARSWDTAPCARIWPRRVWCRQRRLTIRNETSSPSRSSSSSFSFSFLLGFACGSLVNVFPLSIEYHRPPPLAHAETRHHISRRQQLHHSKQHIIRNAIYRHLAPSLPMIQNPAIEKRVTCSKTSNREKMSYSKTSNRKPLGGGERQSGERSE